MRSLATFPVKVRDGQIELIVPEHIPAFCKKKFLKRETIDPRTMIILGDNETALAAIDALRMIYTGRIILIPCSPYGQFENVEMMKSDLSPLSKNQCYFVENDYLDRANVDVLKGKIKVLDTVNRRIVLKGYRKPIEFDKVLIAWGSQKKRIQTNFSNVHYIEDRHSHARLHNELIKAKSVTILGNSTNAFVVAEAARNYLDDIGKFDVKVTLMTDHESDVRQTMGKGMENYIKKQLQNNRINVLTNVTIKELKGENTLDAIYFNKEEQFQNGKIP